MYHVTSRGDRHEPIFAVVFAYCLMGNHYHFVLQTRQPNLSRLMRHINGVYTQSCNRRHGKTGHLFQGRFKAVLVDEEAYRLEVCRYVDLNPVRAGMVKRPQD
ncbi:transposase [Noviherbaspirillum saxi]|uniref:transposase n=1 Tax=Noviherbaspirillum saxi TaxID=2320863 RepID=UPI0018F28349|nr:transposase [Noviherbaspirillum saxi]